MSRIPTWLLSITSTFDTTLWKNSQRTGVNLTGMNMELAPWRVGGTGPTRNTDYPTFATALFNWFQTHTFGAVRLMFTWEAVQSALSGSVPPASGAGYANYWADLTATIASLLSRGIYVSLCPWQFNAASGDTDITYDGASFTSGQFADFWGKFATAINAFTGNDKRVAFDLINEPHTHAESGGKAGDIGITLANWFAAAQAAITSIRGAGATNLILVPGMAYADAASFVSNGSAAAYLTLTDPGSNTAVTVHNYAQFNAHSTSSTAHSAAMSAIVSWARTHGVLVQVGEIAADDNANGVTTLQAQTSWADWVSYQASNLDVLFGWTWWGNSESGWWDAADFHWGLTLDDGATSTKFMTLIQSSLGTTPR